MGERKGYMAAPKKPRIRKTAPTVRQRVEQTTAKAEKPEKKKRIRPVVAKAGRPLKKVPRPHLPNNRFGRILRRILGWLTPNYIINSWREVKLVTWPNRKETWRLTAAVFIFATIFGALVAGVDKVLDILFKNLVLK
jgi:preprotein translocase SecE subunit